MYDLCSVVHGLWFRVLGSVLRVENLGIRVWGHGFELRDLMPTFTHGSYTHAAMIWRLGCGAQGVEIGFWVSGLWFHGSWSMVYSSGFRV